MFALMFAQGNDNPIFEPNPETHLVDNNMLVIGLSGGTQIINFFLISQFSKVWVAKVRARTHTCDVRLHVCVCVRNDL